MAQITTLPQDSSEALPGRSQAMRISGKHRVLPGPMTPPFGDKQWALFGMGCFWGAERRFWQTQGVVSTAVGYSAGFTPNPSYEEVCTGLTGHNEVVLVVFEPGTECFRRLLQVFWTAHDPTSGMRQGGDVGTQYRSGIYLATSTQLHEALESKQQYQAALSRAGHSEITTEVQMAGPFYYAEEYHQQYLDKNPNGYCGLRGTGVEPPAFTVGSGSIATPDTV